MDNIKKLYCCLTIILVSVLSACTTSEGERTEASSTAVLLPKKPAINLSVPLSPCKKLADELNQGKLITPQEPEYENLMNAWQSLNAKGVETTESIKFLRLNSASNDNEKPTTHFRVYANQIPVWPHIGIWHKSSKEWFQTSDSWMKNFSNNSVDQFDLSRKEVIAIAEKLSTLSSGEFEYIDHCQVAGTVDPSDTVSKLWLVSFAKGAEGLTAVVDDTTQKILKVNSLSQY